MKGTDNNLLKTELMSAEIILKSFYANCELAAVKNDGVIDKNEKKILKKIKKANARYLKEISKIIG